MKNSTLLNIFPKNIFLLACIILFISCKPDTPNPPYQYEANPTFTWGYAEFYGDYYRNYDNENNVVALNLFTDGLKVNDKNELVGTGQYLIIEDVFSAPSDTLLPVGNYKVEETGLPFTFYGGKKFEDNRQSIPSGAYIYYIEPDPTKSKLAYITGGNININRPENDIHNIQCNFTLDEKTEFRGEFRSELLYIDQSISKIRRKISIPFNYTQKVPKRGF